MKKHTNFFKKSFLLTLMALFGANGVVLTGPQANQSFEKYFDTTSQLIKEIPEDVIEDSLGDLLNTRPFYLNEEKNLLKEKVNVIAFECKKMLSALKKKNRIPFEEDIVYEDIVHIKKVVEFFCWLKKFRPNTKLNSIPKRYRYLYLLNDLYCHEIEFKKLLSCLNNIETKDMDREDFLKLVNQCIDVFKKSHIFAKKALDKCLGVSVDNRISVTVNNIMREMYAEIFELLEEGRKYKIIYNNEELAKIYSVLCEYIQDDNLSKHIDGTSSNKKDSRIYLLNGVLNNSPVENNEEKEEETPANPVNAIPYRQYYEYGVEPKKQPKENITSKKADPSKMSVQRYTLVPANRDLSTNEKKLQKQALKKSFEQMKEDLDSSLKIYLEAEKKRQELQEQRKLEQEREELVKKQNLQKALAKQLQKEHSLRKEQESLVRQREEDRKEEQRPVQRRLKLLSEQRIKTLQSPSSAEKLMKLYPVGYSSLPKQKNYFEREKKKNTFVGLFKRKCKKIYKRITEKRPVRESHQDARKNKLGSKLKNESFWGKFGGHLSSIGNRLVGRNFVPYIKKRNKEYRFAKQRKEKRKKDGYIDSKVVTSFSKPNLLSRTWGRVKSLFGKRKSYKPNYDVG